MLQGRWWKKSVLATSSVVIIFSFCYFWSWLQSHEFFELWSLINSLFPNFHPFLHPFLIYPLTCLIAIFNYYYFQFEKPLHSQCCSVIPAKLVDLLCPLVWVGRWREPRIHAEEPERQGARSPQLVTQDTRWSTCTENHALVIIHLSVQVFAQLVGRGMLLG